MATATTVPQTKRMAIYQQMDDIFDSNGKPTEFNIEERLQLKGTLCDMSDRIRKAADSIEV